MELLLRRLVEALGPGADVDAAGRSLLSRYREPHRRYHTQEHLAEMLKALDLLAGPASATSVQRPIPVSVVCAVFWHDAVYEPRATDNEQRSAELAAEMLPALGLPPAEVAEVVRLILLTASHRAEPGDDAGALLCDADLAVLAAQPARYARYADDVRSEYAHLTDAEFRQGRAHVLTTLLATPALFATDPGRRTYEERARTNVMAELESLSGGAADAARRPSTG